MSVGANDFQNLIWTRTEKLRKERQKMPSSFRRGVPMPKILRLHYGEIPESEQKILFGVPTTSAMRTILDIWEEGSLPKATLRQAFQQAKSRGKITRRQGTDLLHDARFASIARELEAA